MGTTLKNEPSKWPFVVYLGLVVCSLTVCFTTTADAGNSKDPSDYLQAGEQDIQRWREMKFGLFVHWGPVSLMGVEIGWGRAGPRPGRSSKDNRPQVPIEVYDNLYKSFYPAQFDAKQWVQIARDAGMKYLVFTTKHHDGFCMFDSALTDYKITNSPFKRDIVKELADACHEAGLKLGFYYSPPDWYHPDYRSENHARYIKYLHGQLRELCTNYGKVDIIWFDGLGGKPEDWDAENLIKMVRRLQPHVIINNRAGLEADYDTPEQNIGKFQTERAWETCMTIGDQWAWKPNDSIKSLKQCIQTLVKVAGADGNFLFNVGPMPTGEIEPRQVARLKEMGDWLRKYGQSIYGTRGGPFKDASWGVATHKGNKIYVHILNWRSKTVTLPPIQTKIIASSLLTGGTTTVKQTEESIEVTVPKAYQQELDTIIMLRLDGPAAEVKPASAPAGLYSTTATASSVNPRISHGLKAHDPSKAFDGNFDSYWTTDKNTRQAWLELDMEKPATFNRALISEPTHRRAGPLHYVQQFELQHKDGDQWQTFARGREIGDRLELKFSPVTARYVRLNILKASSAPAIAELQLFAPDGK